MTPEQRLKGLGITLPEAPEPLGAYVPAIRVGSLLFLSGILPLVNGKLARAGKVGRELTPEEGKEMARLAAVNALAVVKANIGELQGIKRCVRLAGYVASVSTFTGHAGVLNGASELLFEVLGERGRHTRVAVGVGVLPMNSPVEIEFIFEVE